MEIFEAIKSRRSIKSFDRDRPVEGEKIRQILEAGLWAPSAHNVQPVRYIVVTKPEMIVRLEREIYTFGLKIKKLRPLLALFVPKLRGEKGDRIMKSIREHAFHGAPAVILIGGDPSMTTTLAIDCTLAAQNIMLAAHALGVGTCYIGWGAASLNASGIVSKELGGPKNFKVNDVLAVGYPKQVPRAQDRKPVDDVTTWVQ